MELQSDRWRLTWRDAKKAALTALMTTAAATLTGFVNFQTRTVSLPTVKDLYFTGAAAAVAFSAEMIRRWSTDRVKSAQVTIEKAEKRQLRKLYGPQ